jgi:hypothetical protein
MHIQRERLTHAYTKTDMHKQWQADRHMPIKRQTHAYIKTDRQKKIERQAQAATKIDSHIIKIKRHRLIKR